MNVRRTPARETSACGDTAPQGVDGRAIDPASLQGVADLKAFRLVREGSDREAVERAEIADIDLLDLRLNAGDDPGSARLSSTAPWLRLPNGWWRVAAGSRRRRRRGGAGRLRAEARLPRSGRTGATSGSCFRRRSAVAAALRLGGGGPARARRGGRAAGGAAGLRRRGRAPAVHGRGLRRRRGGADGSEPVTEPNQRVRRLPLLAAAAVAAPSATEVLQRRGEASAVRVGGAGRLRCGPADCSLRSSAAWPPDAPRSRRRRSTAAPRRRAAALGDQRVDLAAAADLARRGELGLGLAARARRLDRRARD